MDTFLQALIRIGLSEKAARVYHSALPYDGGTVQELATYAKLKRTTIYYTLEELESFGAFIKTQFGKKTFYRPTPPHTLLKTARERLQTFEDSVNVLEEMHRSNFVRPNIELLYGAPGFKHIWEKIFKSKTREYLLITSRTHFMDFVSEKYLVDEIIAKKKKLDVKSKQLMPNIDFARTIQKKDLKENRETRLFDYARSLPFSEIIGDDFVAFVSPKFENVLVSIENSSFADTRRILFDVMWNSTKN